MLLSNGREVLVNTGGPDRPAVIEQQPPPNAELKGMLLVRFINRSAAWLDPASVRPMLLSDHQRIHGKRFCDWQYVLWYTLIFHYAESFGLLERGQLATFWQSGWSEAATARHLAASYGWPCLTPHAHLTAPAYARPYVADVGNDPVRDAVQHTRRS
jgi:hypothetical protein